MMKYLYGSMVFYFLLSWSLFAQAPAGYYSNASGLYGSNLKSALHQIINNHTAVAYNTLFAYFKSTDAKPDSSVWDMYSDIPGAIPPYVYFFIPQDQCGNYSQEGDCYNREHSFPRSWFGGDVMPMYSDLFHLYPTDGYVNGQRGNLPYGIVQTPNWVSQNGSKRGSSGVNGYSGTVFEPIDAYKGDLARALLYMAVRYHGQDALWPGSDMTDGAEPKPWALVMLRAWNQQDPVSQKEIDRNNAVYAIQNNRNPFIDYPQFVEDIWSPTAGQSDPAYTITGLLPNPASDHVSIHFSKPVPSGSCLQIITPSAGLIHQQTLPTGANLSSLNLNDFPTGLYAIRLLIRGETITRGSKLMIVR